MKKIILIILILSTCSFLPWNNTDEIPIILHCADEEYGFRTSQIWIDNQIMMTNLHFFSINFSFSVKEINKSKNIQEDIISKDDKNNLAQFIQDKNALNIFIIQRVSDSTRKRNWIGGRYWNYSGSNRKYIGSTYLIVSQVHGRPDVMAHEIGHFFSLGHTKDNNNLMCQKRIIYGSQFSKTQLQRMKRWMLNFLNN